MRTELYRLHWLWNETVNRLDILARDVREAKNVMEAANFARWLNFSGIIQIFKDNPSARVHLEVDAVVVQTKVNDLLYECGELFRGGKADPKYAQSDIAEINRKLDVLTAALSSTEQVVTVVSAIQASTTVKMKRRKVNAVEEMVQQRGASDLTVLGAVWPHSREIAVPAETSPDACEAVMASSKRGAWASAAVNTLDGPANTLAEKTE